MSRIFPNRLRMSVSNQNTCSIFLKLEQYNFYYIRMILQHNDFVKYAPVL